MRNNTPAEEDNVFLTGVLLFASRVPVQQYDCEVYMLRLQHLRWRICI